MAFTGIKSILKEFRRRLLSETQAQASSAVSAHASSTSAYFLPAVDDGDWCTNNRVVFPLGGGIYLYSCCSYNTADYTKAFWDSQISSTIASIAYEGGNWNLLSGVASLGGDAKDIAGDPFWQDSMHIGLYSCNVNNNSSSNYTVAANTRIVKIMMVVQWSK